MSAGTVSKKALLSAAEIARLRLPGLPSTKANVISRAEKEDWYFEEMTGLGGKRRVYELPARYQEGTLVANCVLWLQHELGYPAESIRRNVDVRVGHGHVRRLDIVVYSAGLPGQHNEEILIECGAQGSGSYERGIEHLRECVAALPGVRWVVWTDGHQRIVFEIAVREANPPELIQVADLPRYLEKIERLREASHQAEMSDAELLEAIIVGVETFAQGIDEPLTPERKATFISLFYRYFLKDGRVDQAKLAEMLKKVA